MIASILNLNSHVTKFLPHEQGVARMKEGAKRRNFVDRTNSGIIINLHVSGRGPIFYLHREAYSATKENYKP